MRMRCLILFVLAIAIAANAAEMTHEEQVVRATYAKLAYSARLGVYLHYALDTEHTNANAIRLPQLQAELDKQVSFQFQKIRVGELSDISGLYWEDLVTKPDHDLVSVAYNLQRMAGQETTPPTSMYFVMADWGASTDYEADWHIPVSKVIGEMLPKDTGMPDVAWSRYAAYTVSVAVGVGQRTYQALFLFGKHPDGSEVIWRTDHVLGMGTLDMLYDRSLYPEPLLETYLRELPPISAWIATAGVAFGSDQRDIVCNGVTGKCGIPMQALKKSLQVPIDPKVRAFHEAFRQEAEKLAAAGKTKAEDTIASCSDANYDFTLYPSAYGSFDHASPSSVTLNSHSVTQPFVAICQYSSNGTQYCNTTCDIGASGTGNHTDHGSTVTGYCHVVALNYASGNSVANNAGASCTGTMAGAAMACTTNLCDCNVSVSVAGVISGTGKDIWSTTTSPSATCAAVSDPTYNPGGGCAAWQAAHKNGAQDAPPPGCGGTEPDCGDDGEDPCCYCPGSGANPSLPLCGDCGDSAALMNPDRLLTPASCQSKRPRNMPSEFPSTLDR